MPDKDFNPEACVIEDAEQLSAADVAAILGIGLSTVFKYFHDGRITGRRGCNATPRSPLRFTTFDLAFCLRTQHFHSVASAIANARIGVRNLRKQQRERMDAALQQAGGLIVRGRL